MQKLLYVDGRDVLCPPKNLSHLKEVPLGNRNPSHSFLLLRSLLSPAGDGLCSWLVQEGRLDIVRCTCCCCRCFWLHQPFAVDVSHRGLGDWGWSLLSQQCCFSVSPCRWSCTNSQAAKTFHEQSRANDCVDQLPFFWVGLSEYLHPLLQTQTQRSTKAHSVRAIRGSLFL